MRYLAFALLLVLVVGCSKREKQQPYHPPQPYRPEVQPEPSTPAIPSQPPRNYSASYVRGYHDGYDGNWLAPANWLVAGDYRAGWSAGERDRKNGRPNKFE